MRTHPHRSQHGFTLIELLITIVILAILSGIAVLAVGRFRSDANTASCDADRRLLLTALTGYRANNASPPSQLQELTSGSTKFVDATINGNELVGDGYTLVYDPTSGSLNDCTAALALGGSGGSGGPTSTPSSTPTTAPPAVDTVAPTTTSALSGTAGSAGWYRSNVNVTLTAADSGSPTSGVSKIVYEVGSEGAQTVMGSSATVAVSAEGTTTVAYHAEDSAGNAEATKTLTLKIDKTAPAGLTITRTGTNERQPSLNGNAGTSSAGSGDAAMVTVRVINIDTGATAFSEPASVATGTWSRPWPSGNLGPNANYRAEVVQSDAAGNVTTQTTTWVAGNP